MTNSVNKRLFLKILVSSDNLRLNLIKVNLLLLLLSLNSHQLGIKYDYSLKDVMFYNAQYSMLSII